METITIDVDGKEYTGLVEIKGTRKLRFTVHYNDFAKSDHHDYAPNEKAYLMTTAKQVLWEMVTGRTI